MKIFLLWNYAYGGQLAPGSVVKLTLRLFVSSSISGVTNFSFTINIGVGLEKSLDVNRDRTIDIQDASLLASAWDSGAGSSNYNYRCDFDNDGTVDISDAAIFAAGWQK
jgi:hypothetical protein